MFDTQSLYNEMTEEINNSLHIYRATTVHKH